MTGQVHFECDDRIGTATLDNPRRRNALTEEMLADIADNLPQLAAQGARALVIRGDERSFCGGYDLTRLPSCGDGASYADGGHPLMRALDAIENFPGSTVAALGGHAVGGGCLLAMSCDLRYARDGVRWSIPATRLGVVYPERGVRRLVATVGLGRAQQVLLLADSVGTEEGLAWGLYNGVFPGGEFDTSVQEIAARLGRRAPLAVNGLHAIVQRAVLPSLAPETQHLIDELTEAALASEDMKEGLAALLQKRRPEFNGR